MLLKAGLLDIGQYDSISTYFFKTGQVTSFTIKNYAAKSLQRYLTIIYIKLYMNYTTHIAVVKPLLRPGTRFRVFWKQCTPSSDAAKSGD